MAKTPATGGAFNRLEVAVSAGQGWRFGPASAGSQYASGDFQATLRRYGMRGSMSRKGNCWDNAVTETLFGSLKVERLHDISFETRRQAKDEVIDWMTFYNRKRMHSTLGYLSPMDFKQIWRRQQTKLAA